MLILLGELLFAILLLIAVPVVLFVGTFLLLGTVLFVVSIPVVLCHWAYEWIKDCINRL